MSPQAHSFAGGSVAWSQAGRDVFLAAGGGRWHFTMPDGFSLEETHPDLTRVASQFLLGRWIKGILHDWAPSRRPGQGIGLAFSGGGDSTAAMLLLPADTHLVYLERSFPSALRHANAQRFFARLADEGRPVIGVASDHETIRTHFEATPPGFSMDMAVIAHVVLLADHLGLGAVSTGMNMGASYFDQGRRFRDFADSDLLRTLGPRMRSIGLEYIPVTAGTHEALTDHIVRSAGLIDWAIGCLRSQVSGASCGECKKCFRRDAKEGVLRNPGKEVRDAIRARPPKSVSTWLYSMQRLAEHRRLPRWASTAWMYKTNLGVDTTVLRGFYAPALELIPGDLRGGVRTRLESFAEPMPDPNPIHSWDLAPGY